MKLDSYAIMTNMITKQQVSRTFQLRYQIQGVKYYPQLELKSLKKNFHNKK